MAVMEPARRFRIRYKVAHNRYCANIGRQHKSNGIYLEADLGEGTLRQHCWDPDCRAQRYRSEPVRFPDGVGPNAAALRRLEEFALESALLSAMERDPGSWGEL
jgi:hypothetical protein